jgi:antirestriction protein ArdC
MDRINQTLNGILEVFKSGEIPACVAFASFPPFKIPSAKWSYLNHIMMAINGTNDGRGYRQWIAAGRHVKKGAKAFYIFAPRIKKEKNEKGEEETALIGFLEIPVFKVQDTEGDPLDYEQTGIQEFPLMEKAKEWGLNVSAVSENGRYWGAYNGREIKLATPEECVFFHELSHHAHKLVIGDLKPGQDWKQEIVAELSAAALCRIVGLEKETTGNSYRYIERYAKEAGLNPVMACLKVINETEKVLKLIMEESAYAPSCTTAGLLEASQKEKRRNHQ